MSDNQGHNEHHSNGGEPPVKPGEYRIIPADRSTDVSGNSAVDIPGLFAALRNRRKLIAVITGCCLLAGILYVLFSTSEYQAKAEVLPKINNSAQGGLGQLLQKYGGVLGMSGYSANNLANRQYISPKIYPVIVHSLSFQSAMLQDTVYFGSLDSSMTLFQYFAGDKGEVDEPFPAGGSQVNIQKVLHHSADISSLTKQQMAVINEMRERVEVTFENGNGVMNIQAVMPDAVASAQVCSNVIERLKSIVKKYHTGKAQNILDYSNEQYQDAREKFLNAQNELATFKDEHTNLVTAASRSRLKYLQSKYNLAFNVFNRVAQKRVGAKMNFQKSIPVFNIIQQPNVPLHRYSPQWIPVILISIVIGLVLSFLVVSLLFIYKNMDYR